MNKALHFNEDSLITSQSSNIRIVLIQKVLMQLQRGTNAMIAELVFGEILIKFLEKFWSSFWRMFDQVFGESLIKFLECIQKMVSHLISWAWKHFSKKHNLNRNNLFHIEEKSAN